MTFSQAFVPAVNKDGLSRLTFLGVTQKSGKSKVKDDDGAIVFEEDGTTPRMRDWAITNFEFDVLGKFKGKNQKVTITAGDRISDDNLLGKTLTALGYGATVETEITDDGFEVESTDEDDEGFSQVEEEDSSAVITYLESLVGTVFVARVYKETEGKRKGFFAVDVSTLKPFIKPAK